MNAAAEPSALAVPDAASSPALLRARTLETLEAAYGAWGELKAEHAAARLRFEAERRRLEEQGSFLLNSLKAAGGEVPAANEPAQAALSVQSSLADYVKKAEAELAERLAGWRTAQVKMEAGFQAALAELRALLRERALRFVGKVRPRLKLWVRTVGPSRRILHLERVGDDDAVMLCLLLSGTLPTRHGFLGDDSTEDVLQEPPPLYPDEEVTPEAIRPTSSALAARFEPPPDFAPVKGFIPLRVPRPEGAAFYRLKSRGPVLEVEAMDGEGFTPLLPKDEAERIAGHLLRLKLEGKLELEIDAG